MIEMDIPGRGMLHIEHLVFDVNGTLAVDGQLIDGVQAHFEALREQVSIHLITADTHGRQAEIDQQLDLQAHRLERGQESTQKADFVRSLDPEKVIAIGQGANDAGMLREAIIGICVLSPEGTAVSALQSADILAPGILAALELLENPKRLVASLRQ